MSDDDVASFFAQKKAKKGGKTKGIQSVDALAKKLEKSVKVQEELDREEQMFAEQQNQKVPVTTDGPPPPPEDSEWIEQPEETGEVDLGAFKIREMDTHEEESEDEEEKNKENTDVHKTWKTEAEMAEIPEVIEEVVVVDKKSQVYVPKARLLAAVTHSSGKTPDIKDSMQFPSLADATDIEAELEKKKKTAPTPTPSAWQQQPARPAWGGARTTPVAAATEDSATHGHPKAEKEEETKPADDSTGPKKYVPPWARKTTGTS